MQIDKETPDNGINIKFGADRTPSSKKGEYRLVTQNSVNGKKKRLNGTTKQAARVPYRQQQQQQHLCASCAALVSGSCPRGGAANPRPIRGRLVRVAKGAIRALAYIAASLVLACLGWLTYTEFFGCLWVSAQSLVYTTMALLLCTGALLSLCKNGEFTVDAHLLYVAKNALPQGEMVPPDGGWGWFVLFAAVMVNVLIPGGIKSFGVIYKAFLDTYSAKASSGAWIPALCYFLYSSLGPLSSVLSVKYSYRTVTLIGGTFAAVGMMISYFATSIEYLYISYGVFVGIGAGLAFPPTVYIVTSYFVRLRGLANGFCISGSSLGSIILPPVLTKMLTVYRARDTILIMGALTLNVWACALLYEPVEKHLIPAKSPRRRDEEEALEPLAEVMDVDINITSPDETKNNSLLSPSEAAELTSTSNGEAKGAAPIVPKSASSVALENYYKPAVPQGRMRKISMPVSGREIAGQMHSTPALHAVPERMGSESNRLSRRSRPPPLSPSTSSFNYISTPYHGSTLTALHPEYASTLTLNAITSTFRKSPEKTAKQTKEEEEASKNRFFDCGLLKDPMYLVILISNSTNAISYTNFVIVLTLYAQQLKFSDSEASALLSIVSLFDLAGRIGGAALSDTKLMPKHFYFVGGLFISGVSLAILPIAKTYTMVAVYCSIFGIASGVYVGVTAVVMADMLGVEKLTSSYGISLFVNGMLQLIGPPICGALQDYLQSWGPIFTVLGMILVAGSLLWGFVPFIRKRQERERREAADAEAATVALPEKL